MRKLVKSKQLIDCTGRQTIEKGCILINGNLIEAVGKLEEFEGIENIDILDYSNYYIIPGLIDSHTHLSITPSEGSQIAQMKMPGQRNILRSIPNIKKSLKSGVTTMRIMGEENHIDIDLKNAIEEQLIEGPRLLVSGIGIAATHAHGAALTFSDGVEGIRKTARANFAKGADLLKIFITGGVSSTTGGLNYYTYSLEEIKTAVDEADRVGKYVAAHAHGGKGVDLCIEAGIRNIEHGCQLNEEQIEKIVKHNMWITGTFTILLHSEGIEKTDMKNNPIIREKILKARETVADTYKKIIQSGAKVTLGTDSMHGYLYYEAKCYRELGASTEEALLAVTKKAAESCCIDNQLGTLEKGKLADFVILGKNPLEDISNLKYVTAVYKEGKEV